MKPQVYIETTVISYLTARPARDVVVAGHQQRTRDWWERASDRFELVVSTHRYRRRQRGRVPRNLEFPPSRERGGKAAHRIRVPPGRFRAAYHLHSRGADGGHRQ